VQGAVRRMSDDVSECAAAIDPELPALGHILKGRS
jgi:hypothetical protein